MTASSPSAPATDAGVSLAGTTPQPIAVRETWWDRERLFLSTCQLVVPLFCLTAYLLSLRDVQPASDFGRILACVNIWLSAIPLWVFLVARRRMIPFPAFALALYSAYFSFPIFMPTPLFLLFHSGPAWESVDETLLLVVVGTASMLTGLYGTGFVVARLPKVRREIDLKRALPALATIAVLSFAVRFATFGVITRTFGSILYTIGYFGQIALSALLIAWLRGYLNLGYKALTLGLFFLLVAVGLASGLLASVAMPVAGLLFAYAWERRRLPWSVIIAGVLIFIPFNAAKMQFRTMAQTDSGSKANPANLVNLVAKFATLTYENVENGKLGSDDEMTRSGQARTNQLGIFAVVVNETPRVIPYWDGYTYSDILWHLIPRVVVPDKPAPAIGQEFPRRYELIGYWDYATSVNLPQVIEFYINFGPVGLLLGMLLVGFIYAFLDHCYSGTVAGAVVGCTLFSGLMNMESNFSPVFGSLVFHMIFCGLLILLFPTKKKPALNALA
jgi:hypothetical protein